MRKVILDFRNLISEEEISGREISRREIHDYIAAKMDFPEYYGHNLDALYDCLTDIREPTAVGIAMPEKTGPEDSDRSGQGSVIFYLEKVRKTFLDAEKDNPELAVLDLWGGGEADER